MPGGQTKENIAYYDDCNAHHCINEDHHDIKYNNDDDTSQHTIVGVAVKT